MSTEKRYYLAAGEVEQKVREFFEERAEVLQRARAIAKKAGGSSVIQGDRMAGVYFDGEVPAGWRRQGYAGGSKGPYCVPQRRSKVGKELHDQITEAVMPGASELHARLTSCGPHLQGMRISWVTAEITDGKAIVHVPAGMDYEPPGCRLLKNSEYWEIKEKQEGKAA